MNRSTWWCARQRMLQRDSMDVARSTCFSPKRAQKTLFAVAGRGHDTHDGSPTGSPARESR
jgi:hypothetical protein